MDYTKIKNVVIIYHNNCIDGIAACWATYNYFKSFSGNEEERFNITYFGLSPQCANLFYYLEQRNIDLTENKYQFIFVDICPSMDILRQLIIKNTQESKLIILDHHETNKNIFKDNLDELKGNNIYWTFDLSRSGCQIAWDTFHVSKHLGIPEPYPWFIKYIGDGDLWKFEEPDAKLIYNILGDNFKTISSLEFLSKNTFTFFKDKYIREAQIIQKYKNKKLETYINKANKTLFKFENYIYNTWFINCTDIELVSELGNQLTTVKFNTQNIINDNDNIRNNDENNDEYPDFIIIIKNINLDGTINISLRSNKHTKPNINVATIASHYNGGGHPQASGFTIKNDDFMSIIM